MTAGVRIIDLILGYVITRVAPVALTSTTFLCLRRVDTFKPVLGEELGKVVVMGSHGTFGEALVILVVELV